MNIFPMTSPINMKAYMRIPLQLQFKKRDPKKGGRQGKTAFINVSIAMYAYVSNIQTQDKEVMNNLKK